ncbi:MAG: carboxypeptidase-like regulatory domain-containing protein [Candidatus Bathyarchaeia archaeon]
MKAKRGYLILIMLIALPLAFVQPPPVKPQDTVNVSPGEYSYKLGQDYPTEDTVKLEYPKSTVLTNTTGELLFNVTLTNVNQSALRYGQVKDPPNQITKTLILYVPPEFKLKGISSVWTSFTNDYSPLSISLIQTGLLDPIAPGWWKLTINDITLVKDRSLALASQRSFQCNTSQYVRIFNVTSPTVAGRYFFKVFIVVNGEHYSIGAENFPTLVVKADLNPAYISGVVRYGGPSHPELYGSPIDASKHSDGAVLLPNGYGGIVYAEGLTAEGRRVEAKAYFNATCGGRYTLYGLAPGTYNITAQAAGFPPQRLDRMINVERGQSLEGVDIYLNEGKSVEGFLYSKHGYAETPWGYVYNITHPWIPQFRTARVEVTSLEETVIASTPLRLVDPFNLAYQPGDLLVPTFTQHRFALRREVSFDGHIPQDYANYTSGIPSGDYYVKAHVAGYVQPEETVIHLRNETTRIETAIDLHKTSCIELTVHFKDKMDRGASPTKVGGFLYAEALDAAGAVVGFNISYVPPGLSHFSMEIQGIDVWNRLTAQESKVTAWIYARDRGLYPGTYRINVLFVNRTADFIALNALLLASPEQRLIYPIVTPQLTAAFSAEVLELANRGTPVYFQLDELKATAGGICTSRTEVSLPLVKGGGFNVTLYAVDWEKPIVNRNWNHPYSPIKIDIYDERGSLMDSLYGYQPPPEPLRPSTVSISTEGFVTINNVAFFTRAIGLKTGRYMLKIYTYGYLQDPLHDPLLVQVSLGDISDTRANLVKGARIELTLIFKTEGLMDPINNKLEYARPLNGLDATPLRVELFDEEGELSAATVTYIPAGVEAFQVTLEGFLSYYGNPRLLWTNFYDTTDGSRQNDYGIEEGSYLIRVTVPGYLQPILLSVEVNSGPVKSRPTVSVVQSLERMGYLKGHVIWVNWCGRAYPLSWAAVTAYSTDGMEGYTYTLDGDYEMWLPSGDYDFGLSHPGFKDTYFEKGLHIGPGSVTTLNFMTN